MYEREITLCVDDALNKLAIVYLSQGVYVHVIRIKDTPHFCTWSHYYWQGLLIESLKCSFKLLV